jgi:hypothetical protein
MDNLPKAFAIQNDFFETIHAYVVDRHQGEHYYYRYTRQDLSFIRSDSLAVPGTLIRRYTNER